MIDSVHLSDSTIYGSSWVDPELRPLFSEQNRVRGWLEVMTVLTEVQAEFSLIPEQAAAEIKVAYENLKIDEIFLKEAGEGFVKTNHSLMGLINALKNRCRQPVFSGSCGFGLTKNRHATLGSECSCNLLDQYPRSLC
jgi:adenylosuccinate lyase